MNRIAYKILFTGLNFLITTCVLILVARSLGAENYGKISYIFATYDFLLSIFTLTLPNAYVFFLSEKTFKKSTLNVFISGYLGLVILAILLITLLTFYNDFGQTYIWGYISSPIIIYGSFVIVSAVTLQNILLTYSDATSQTVISENSRFTSKLFLFVFVLIFSLFGVLALETYLSLVILSLILFFVIYFRVIEFKFLLPNGLLLLRILKEFFYYMKPLILFTFISIFFIYFGKYTLQFTSGSTEQGYFGFAFQIAMLPVTVISPIMPIIMQEITEKFKEDNILELKSIFADRFFKMLPLYSLATIFIFFNSEEIILFTAGEDFLGAKISLQILTIYSFLNIFVLFNSAIHLSTKRNKEYGIISSFAFLAGCLCLAYLFSYHTLDASGLAKILVATCFFQSFCLLAANVKFLHIKKLDFFIQIISINVILFLMIFLIHSLNLHILLNFFMTFLAALALNFIFHDHLGFYNIYKSIAGKHTGEKF